MEESILNDLGFDPVYLLIASAILTLILMVVTILCLINMRKLYRRYDIFMRGKDARGQKSLPLIPPGRANAAAAREWCGPLTVQH